ncbi:MAG: alpha/beta hydrolase [Cyclobacteriaceae bacterium]
MSKINFKVKGDGHPLILIHGFCETSEIWDSFASKIADGIQVISIDLPGFGKSELPPSPFTLDDIAVELNNWVLKHEFDNSVLLGHSLGGYVSLAMVARRPELFKAFGLFHSTARPDTEVKRLNRIKVIEFVRAHGIAPFAESFIPGLYYQKNHPSIGLALKIALETPKSTFMDYTIAMRDRPSRERVIADSEIPVLIIAGQNDTVIEVKSLEEQATLNEKVSFHSLSNVGHMGMFEAENETLSIVNDFILKVKVGL